MNHPKKAKTIKINHQYDCLNCGFKVPKANKTCRNHCTQCLFSLHVDLEFPGDRQSECKSLMEPIKLDQNSKKGWRILHKCGKCKKESWNICAEDDSQKSLILLMHNQNLS